MITSNDMTQTLKKIEAEEVFNRVRKQRYIPRFLQMDIYIDVYNYLLITPIPVLAERHSWFKSNNH